jgi:uncharacterized protein (DUF488 family)
MRIFTVGHSTRDAGEFIELLRSHGITRVVDVRRYPGSRRHPHFSREQLIGSLATGGIAYEHVPDLGGRRTQVADSPNGGWRSASFRAYADHMATPAFALALDQVVAGARADPTAIMCAEAVPWRCHRQLIADVLVARGHEVLHVLGPSRADPHTLNPNARVGADGFVTYPGRPADEQPSLL